ncbi:MAG: hypothetical protein QM781_10400 [Chitinophagaceae bacterium]
MQPMKYVVVTALVIFLSAFSCSKKLCACDPVPGNVFKATVKIANDMSCGKPVLEFPAEAEPHLKKITGKDGLLYAVVGLPNDLAVADKQINVELAALELNEAFACLAIGPWYPQAKVLNAWPR